MNAYAVGPRQEARCALEGCDMHFEGKLIMVGWRERSTDSDLLLLMAHRPRARTRVVGVGFWSLIDTRVPFASLLSQQ